jgi:putative peptide zinc metalloprotease protein
VPDANFLVSSSARPLRVRMRADLIETEQVWQGRNYTVVKDPLTLRFFRFEAEELWLLKMLDGRRSADEIRGTFARQFAPQKITSQELFHFIGSLHETGLLVSDSTGQSETLETRARRNQWRDRKAGLTNILAVRFRGLDPSGILPTLDRFLGWLFTVPALIAAVLMVCGSLALILSNFELFRAKLPSSEVFFSGSNWLWLGVVLACTKVWHEIGHGLCCRRMGAQCHSLGVMLLVFMPCLYCDVTDSWRLPSKWRRAAIAAAGIYLELILASACVYVWWFSQPGLVNMLALNVIVVSSVSTILFNANPLMRFDGYYILCDMVEVPNLRQKAMNVLARWSSIACLGIRSASNPFLPTANRWIYGVYGAACLVWQWMITFSIFMFLYRLFEPAGLTILSQAIALTAVWGLIGKPVVRFIRFITVPGRMQIVKTVRLTTCGLAGGAALIAFLLIPLPHYVECSFIVQPAGMTPVYVEVPGRLETIHVRSGSQVRAGETLVELANPEVVNQVAILEGDRSVAETRYRSRLRQANLNRDAEADVGTAMAALDSLAKQLEQQKRSLQQLRIVAPTSGKVISAAWTGKQDDERNGTLAGWHGHPLEPANRQAWLDSGTVLCSVAPEEGRAEAILAIDQSDIEFVGEEAEVELWLNQSPGVTYSSAINLVSVVEMRFVPRGLSHLHGGNLQTIKDDQNREVPASTTYQVSVRLPELPDAVIDGATGRARIRAGRQTLGRRLWRAVCTTFRFNL